MTTFMDSAWYFLRYCDPHNEHAIFDPAKVEAWLPVDYYIGGKEHAVGHLLYSRFITHVLQRAGLLDLTRGGHGDERALHDEPFRRLYNQGIVYKDGAKMSKSKGNVVSADSLAEEYGADTARLFSFFGGPYDQDLEWSKAGVDGCHRFLKRVWRLAYQVSHAQQRQGRAVRPARPRFAAGGARAAQGGGRGQRGHRGLALQHRHRQADGVPERAGRAVAQGRRRGRRRGLHRGAADHGATAQPLRPARRRRRSGPAWAASACAATASGRSSTPRR